jgi:hypothetical protein
MPINRNKTTRVDLIRKVKAGLAKYYGTGNLVLAGTSFTPAVLQQLLQGDIDASDASTQARAQWLNTVNVMRDTDSKTDPVLRAIRTQVQSQYAEATNADTVLADFGYSPRKKVTKTVETKSTAVAKSLATRAARHTMGSRQKAKVVGVLPRLRLLPTRRASPRPRRTAVPRRAVGAAAMLPPPSRWHRQPRERRPARRTRS